MMIPEIARYHCATSGMESGRRPSVPRLAGLTRLALWLLAGNFLVTCLLAQTSQPPVNVSVSPSSGSGMGPQTFAFTSSSVNGSGYINWMGMLINYGVAPGACSAAEQCNLDRGRRRSVLRWDRESGGGGNHREQPVPSERGRVLGSEVGQQCDG